MNFTKIAVACGLAFAALSAQAAGPTIPAGTRVIFLSGASAPDNFLADIAGSLLTNVVAIRSADTAINHRAFLGQAAAGIPGVPVGTNILFIKRSAGGSVFGVDPVARAARIQTLDFNNCTTLTTGNFAWQCGLRGIDPGIAGHATASNTGLVPDFGVSDVEPALFRQPYNTENGQPQLSPAELATLTNRPVNQIMMGIVATNAVAASTHISRSQYGGMLAGLIQDWSQIDGSTDPVVVCRRVDGSGTQSSYNWFFTGFPCNNASNGFSATVPATAGDSFGFVGGAGTVANPIVIDPSAGFTVIENSGSGDVRNCLTAAQNGTDFNVRGSNNLNYRVLFSNVGGPSKAIGVLSLDSYVTAGTGANGYTFRHLDGAGTYTYTGGTDGSGTQASSAGATGIAPSKANLVNGLYDFVVELSIQARNAAVTNVNGDVVPALSTDAVKTGFFNEFVRRAGSTRYTGNDGGTFVTVPNAFATLPQVASYATRPALVSKFSRGGNTCAPLIAFPPL
ncbi:MAG: hypothetical protein BVN34_05300 [Proteobacteria bacterium ST_bin12]|nr:MAG: hypothetical protein BVN34_05300 [Proteobacteria bacterium ST_bin12]